MMKLHLLIIFSSLIISISAMIFTKTRESSVPRMGKKSVPIKPLAESRENLKNNPFINGFLPVKDIQTDDDSMFSTSELKEKSRKYNVIKNIKYVYTMLKKYATVQ
ncbi:DgyrCDS13937 [Dimorphilus gyrociliatus]|uniref:DgyrCDS13937 n=1 Tax=Dimorphilus gyrociliatus TaxID=2664684 RepID=A0A7I8WC80_9ANNE|nr:DgyrCDS13937 [Dimorphilus gyrociliatus]